MKRTSAWLACILAALTGCPVAIAQAVSSQSFRAGSFMNELVSDAAGNAPDPQLYAEGKRAIRESRWPDAVSIFERVTNAKGEHAAGALYWKAYAENKQGQADKALETCGSLRQQFSGSSWIDDCGALEIEIRASKGQAVEPEPGQSDDLKLLCLATLMRKDPTRARARIEEIVQGDSSEQLKEGAVFILGRSILQVTYPQIVRISYLTGDVRIARGAENEKARRETWETAVMNLPLFDGDSIVTGKDGKVEIEFENSSTVYLAPNSVLTCDDLHTTDGVPHSEIGLLSGTLAMRLDSLKPGETFILNTPTNDVLTRFPQKAQQRISSYLDGMAVTSQVGGVLYLRGSAKRALRPGKILFFDKDHLLAPWDPARGGDLSAFDAWVTDRCSARSTAMDEEMKDSGLTTPIPGMADMRGQGKFYSCEPYGTCWEPTGESRNALPASERAPEPTLEGATPGTSPPSAVPYRGEFFPCLPGALETWYHRGAEAKMQGADLPYAWAVCHAGWWIERDHHYVWVAGRRIHHHCPVKWVKSGKTTAFVPIHPRDIKGQPPLNRGRAFIPTKGKDGYSLTVTTLDSGHPVALMKSPPRQFRNQPAPLLARAETPHMRAYALRQPAGATGTKLTGPAGVPIRFDHQSRSFSMAHQVMQGGHSTTVYTPMRHVGAGFASGHTGGLSAGRGANSGGGSHGAAARAPASSSGSAGGVSSRNTSTSTATTTNSSAGSSHH